MGKSAIVVKAIASSVSVRRVATCVPALMVSFSGCRPLSQNVIGTRAAVGGYRRTPISSRNLT